MTLTVRNTTPRVERARFDEPEPHMHVAINGVPLCGHASEAGHEPVVEILPAPDGCEFTVTCAACLVAPTLLAQQGVVP